MYDGYVVYNVKDQDSYVWPIRGGQWGDSDISGTVSDAATGAALAGAGVSIGTREVLTDTVGVYHVNIVPGAYSVTASKNGY